MRYGPGAAVERPHDRGGLSRDPAWSSGPARFVILGGNEIRKGDCSVLWRNLAWILGILLAVTLAAPEAAAQRVVARAFLEDPEARLTFEEARGGTYAPFSGVFNKGYSASAFWIRITIDPEAGSGGSTGVDDRLILRIRPPYLDTVELFDPPWPTSRPRITGDLYPWSASEHPSANFSFILPRGEVPRDVWLRLKTTSSSLIDVDVLTPEQAARAELQQAVASALYLGVICMMAAWGFVQWLVVRRVVLLAFVLKQIAALALSLAVFGYLRVLLDGAADPRAIDATTTLGVVAVSWMGFIFECLFLRQYRPARWTFAPLLAGCAVGPVALMLIAAGKTQLALSICVNATALGVAVAMLAVLSTPRSRAAEDQGSATLPKWALITVYAIQSIAVLVVALPLLGLLTAPGFAFVTFQFNALVTGLLMIVLLQVESTRLLEQRRAAALRIQAAEQRAQQERRLREEQADFLSMLTHELRTSLSVLQMALRDDRSLREDVDTARQTIHAMDSLIERCLQAGQLEEGRIMAIQEHCDIAALVRIMADRHDLAGRVHVAHGRDTGCWTDPHLLQIIIANLLDNAVKYGEAGKPIDISIECVGSELNDVEIAVSNRPGNVDWPDPKNLFVKYWRGARARRITGSGLGLYIVARLIDILGGSVRYDPTPSHVRFVVTLPRGRAPQHRTRVAPPQQVGRSIQA